MTRTVFAPHLGHDVRVNGCKVKHLNVRHSLSMRHVMRNADPVIPDRTNFSSSSALNPLVSLMFLNNQLGDCVIAARARRIGLLTYNASGVAYIYNDFMLRTEYGRIGGYVVGDPATDNGCDPAVSADDGVRFGYADGSKDAGWVIVDATNWHEVMLANWVTCGACDLSMALPEAWLTDQMPRKHGDVWDVAGDPDPKNGHNVAVVDHDVKKGLLVDTWGLLVWVTPAAVARYGTQANSGMLIAHVNHDAIAMATQRAPDGFDWETMLSYFDQGLGGHTRAAPVPTPTPQPEGPRATLGQAQAWAANGCHRGPLLMTRESAARHALSGLATGWPVTDETPS